MSAEPQPVRRPLRTARRFLIRALLTVVGVIGGLLCLFVCQNVFAGYPRYHTAVLSIIAMVLISLTGVVAWIVDQRRIDADG
jgi:di/tricarboxylate transporter